MFSIYLLSVKPPQFIDPHMT